MTPAEQVVKALRVLLMVERDGRVVCASWWEAAWSKALMAVVNGDPFSSIQFRAFNAARKSGARWWLVEAESADAARKTFSGHERFDCGECGASVCADEDGCCVTCGADCDCVPWGRILASGGRP